MGVSHDIDPRRAPVGAGRWSGTSVMVVSDAEDARALPEDPFRRAGLQVTRCARLDEAGALCANLRPRMVFLPLTLGGEPAARLLHLCLGLQPAPVVVVIASHDEINAAAEAMRAGAFDCLFLPFSPGRLEKTIGAAMKAMAGFAPVEETPPPTGKTGAAGGAEVAVLTASQPMRSILGRARTIAASQAPVIVTGEVGTGKSLFAKEIHATSPRAHKPLVTLDAPTLNADQLDAAILGEAAEGTLVIEEICELPTALQSRLLALIDGRIGKPDAPRIIATTRHDPLQAIRDGHLRPPLYYRLNVAALALPPLRGRKDDIALIARTRLAEFARDEGRAITGFTEAAMNLLQTYDWPGNVRELVNLVWSMVLTQTGPAVGADALPGEILDPDRHRPATTPGTEPTGLVGLSLAEIERRVIEATIRAEDGSVPRAARVLDVSPSTIYRKREAWENGSDR